MKHLKLFENFISDKLKKLYPKKNKLSDKSDNLLEKNFQFIIDISTTEDIDNAIKEFEKYVEIDNGEKEYLKLGAFKNDPIRGKKPWGWFVKLSSSLPYDSKRKNFSSIDKDLYIEFHTIPVLGRTQRLPKRYNDDDIITIDEFLSVGLAGVKEYIGIKNTIDKYNL